MSTAPQGWQNPRTNWQAADIVHPSELNRIEGNIPAIESGSRTLDPSQAPSGNTGSLRQILSWFANRIRAITGAANWYNAPATTLAAAKSHIDATSGIHRATSSVTANRLIIRDSNGRASVADPTSSSHIATKGYVDGTVNSHANATSVHGATSSATANRIIIRDSAGRAKVAAPSSASDIATKGYVDSLVGPLQAGTAFAYYLTPPDVELSSNDTGYDPWWFQDMASSVVVRILLSGTISYHVQYRADNGESDTFVRILLNGSQIRQVDTRSTSWQTVTGDIIVSPGDIITIQKRVMYEENSVSWRNVRIETAQPTLGIQRF